MFFKLNQISNESNFIPAKQMYFELKIISDYYKFKFKEVRWTSVPRDLETDSVPFYPILLFLFNSIKIKKRVRKSSL